MSWELFQTAYLAADEQTKALIDSDVIARAIDELVANGLIADAQRSTLMKLYPLVVLQVYTPEQFVSELTNQGIANGITIYQTLAAATKPAASNQTETVTPPTQITPNTSSPDPAPQVHSPVPPVRTMAADMETRQQAEPPTQPAATQSTTNENPAAVHYPASPTAPQTPHPAHTPANLPTQPAAEDRVYTTTQEAILRERNTTVSQPTAQPTPTKPNTDEVRWGSAN